MKTDQYKDLAERYDLMKNRNRDRENFFDIILKKYGVRDVLDCACGTGNDLVMFHSLGFNVIGSDLSEAMLARAIQEISKIKPRIRLDHADFRYLKRRFGGKFDAIVCLTNAINEPLKNIDTLKALRSMQSVLRPGGILIFDQGQTDASMKNPPKYSLIINNRNLSRLFVMNYFKNQMEVNIFDFIHTKRKTEFKHNSVRIRIRLKDDWKRILEFVGFKKVEYYGDWKMTPYNKKDSKRLIIIAHKGFGQGQ
jgi:glycine/sarcosine N-methyltransferase